VPGLAVSVCPSCGVPEMVGKEVFVGGCLPGGAPTALETETDSASASAARIHAGFLECGGKSVML